MQHAAQLSWAAWVAQFLSPAGLPLTAQKLHPSCFTQVVEQLGSTAICSRKLLGRPGHYLECALLEPHT